MKHMRKESSQTKLIDRRMYESWEKLGSKSMIDRANEEARAILENHKPLPLDPAAAKEIQRILEDAEGELKERKKFAK
jgi:trimethylamine:corrinoid methyltransferase-like protein